MSLIVWRLAIRNLRRRMRKNMVVGSLLAVGVAVFCLCDSLTESSIAGIRHSFVENFTADLSVSGIGEEPFGIFGPDIPLLSVYGSIPFLPDPIKLADSVKSCPGVAGVACVLSAAVAIDQEGYRHGAIAMGTMANEYFRLFPRMHFVAGAAPLDDSQAWIVLPEGRLKEMVAKIGHPLMIGDPIRLTMVHDQTFTIRELKLAGVVHYEPDNDALSQVVVLDGRTLRELVGARQLKLETSVDAAPSPSPASIDAMFDDPGAGVTAANQGDALNLKDVAQRLGQVNVQGPEVLDHSGAWNFLLIRLQTGADATVVSTGITAALADQKMDLAKLQVRDWRSTAGMAAAYVFALQLAFFVGLSLVGAIILLITTNSLVAAVLERTAEIGTMRALGAKRVFICRLFVTETMLLCAAAGMIGVLIGAVGTALLGLAGIQVNNDLLALMFGGRVLRFGLSPLGFLLAMSLALGIGAISWIHPVQMALRISPVRAMQGK